jgi:hypothetical protein
VGVTGSGTNRRLVTAAVLALCAGITVAGVAGAGAQGGSYTTSTGTQQTPGGAFRFCLRFDRQGKKVDGAINFGIHCHRGPCIVVARGRAALRTKVPGRESKVVARSRRFDLGRSPSKTVGNRELRKMKLKLSGNARRQIRKALAAGGTAKATVVVEGDNGAGKSRTRRRTVKLHL